MVTSLSYNITAESANCMAKIQLNQFTKCQSNIHVLVPQKLPQSQYLNSTNSKHQSQYTFPTMLKCNHVL